MKTKLFLLFFVFSIIFFSCEKNEPKPSEENTPSNLQDFKQSDGIVVLGKKINDPYAIKNMKAAFSTLKSTTEDSPIADILPNKKYLRFLPKDEVELAQLKKDTSNVLFDFPLDYEIEIYGTYYHDPSLPDSSITWQYCVLPIDYALPDIQHELLYEVFIPPIDSLSDDTASKKSLNLFNFYDNLERESFRITGNPLNMETGHKGLFDRWTPEGVIKVVDDGLGTIPLEGAHVQVRYSTNVEIGITNSAGYFKVGKFLNAVHYSIKWERPGFDIRSDNWGQAWYTGPRQASDWYKTFSKNEITWCYAHIHRAAFQYYYKNSLYGIRRPPMQGGIFNQNLHIGAMDKEGTSHYYDFNKFVLAPQVKVYCKYGGYYLPSVYLFGTTIHELAHASHWNIGYSTMQYCIDWVFRNALMPESWASCVEHVVTSDVYKSSSTIFYNKWNNKQDEIFADFEGYTPLFIDLIDSVNQRANHGGSTDYPIDRVSGYTLSQLEDVMDATYFDLGHTGELTEALIESFAISIYKNKLRDSYSNPTSGYINELFSNYY